MRRIKPKWLLGAMVVLVTVLGVSVLAGATGPTGVNINSPTTAAKYNVKAENNVVVNFSYTSSPTVPNSTNVTIYIRSDGTVVGSLVNYPIADAPGGDTLELPVTIDAGTPDGLYNVYLTVANSDDPPMSDSELEAVRVDNTPPTDPGDLDLTESAPDEVDDEITNDQTPTFTWSPSTDGGSGVEGYYIGIKTRPGGAYVIGPDLSIGNVTSYTVPDVSALAEGDYTFEIYAKDNARNASATVSLDFEVDLTPTTTTMVGEPTYTQGLENTVSCNDAAGETNELYEFRRTPDGTTTSGWQTSTSYTFTRLSDATAYAYDVRVKDSAGNIGAWSATTSSTQDNSGPVFTEGSKSPTGWVNVNNPGLSIDVADATSGITDGKTGTFTLTPTGGGSAIDVSGTYSAATGKMTGTASGLADGEYSVTATIEDDVGNSTTTSFAWTFTVDDTNPTAPSDLDLTEVAPDEVDDEITNDQTPTFTWSPSTDGGSGVEGYYIGIKVSGGAYVIGPDFSIGAVTSYTVPDVSALAEGDYTFEIYAKDVAGNSSSTASLDFEVDLTPTTTTMVGEPTYTQGLENTVSCNDAAGETNELYEFRRTPDGTTTSGWQASTSYTFTGLSDATAYAYDVRVKDSAGNIGAWSATTSSTQDNSGPVFGAGSPTGYTADNTPTLSIPVSDATSGIPDGQTGTFTLTPTSGGAPIVSAGTYAAGTGLMTGTSPALADGEFTAVATIEDLVGNEGSSTAWSFRVDTTPPTNPGSPFTGNLGDDGKWYFNTLRPTFSWAASVDPDAPDGSPGSGLRDYSFQFGTSASKPGSGVDAWPSALVDETGIAPTPGAAVQQWTPSSDLPLAVGTEYSARVKAFDNLNNATLWIDSSIIYDPDPPTAPGTPSTTDPTNDPTPEWSWTGSTDAISGVDLYHIQIRRQGSADWDVLDTSLDIPDSTAPADPQVWEQGLQLQDGTYEIRVRAMDVAGNYSDWSGIGTVTVDTTPPAVPGMPQTTSPTNDSTPTWTWGAVSGAASYNVYLDDVLVGNQTETSYAPSTDLPEGQHYLQVSALDALNNESALSEAGYVTIDLTDPAAPVMAGLDAFTSANSVVFTWSGPNDAVEYTFSYKIGAAAWTDVTGLADSTYTLDISAASDGDVIQGKAIAYDAAGNDSAESNVVSTTVDRTGPVVSVVTTPSSPTNNPRPTWTWSGDDGSGSGVKGYWVTLDAEAPIWTTGTSFTPSSDLADGDHVLKVKGVDNLDNVGAEVTFATVTVDTTPPAVPGMPQTTSPTNDTTPTWTWGAVTGAASYKVYLDDVLVGNQTETSYTPSTDLPEGQHYLQVSALDALNNESALSEAGYVTIDTSGPVAPVVTRVTSSPTNEAPQIWTWTRPADAVSYDFGESADGVTPPATFTNVGNVDTYETNFTTDGTHYVMVRAYDALGNAGDWSAAASVVIDRTAPGVPTNLAVPSPTKNNTPTWTWAASTGDVASYEVSLDGGAAVNIGNETKYRPGGALSDGLHNLKVRALDALGNKSDWTAAVEVLVDTKAPEIILLSPLEGNITTASTVLIELSDGPIGSGIDAESARLRIDEHGDWVAPTAIVGDTLYYVMNLSLLTGSDEDHTLELEIGDVVGNLTKKKWMFKLELYREGFGFGRLRFPEESD
jgi:hypothetical protein